MNDIDALKINFEQDQLFLLNICLAFIMFGIALDLKLEDFKRLLKKPKAPIVGLTSQLILLPILTFILTRLWPMPPSVAMGLIMVASCPGGNISNFAVHIAKGNTALSISMTSVVTMFAVIITPLTFSIWTKFIPGAQNLLSDISVNPLEMMFSISQLVLIPLLAGMLINNFFPKFSGIIRKPISKISLVIFAAIIVVALAGNLSQMKEYLNLVFWLVLVHNGLAMIMGYYFAKANGLNYADQKAVCMETGIQNSGLGLVLIFAYFQGLGGMMLVAAWWGIWDMISALSVASYWKWKDAK